MKSIRLPIWLRFFLLIGVAIFAAGAGLFAYRYYTHPVTLTIAVGSIDGEAAKAMSAIASELVSTNKPVRLKVIDSGTALEAANAFSAGKVDLAVVRGDVGDLSQAQAVVVVSHVVVLIIAPPGSSIDGIDGLKGHTVGVVGGAANAKIVDVLTKEYDLANAKVVFKNLALTDARQAIQSKQVSALLVAIPLAEKYLSLVRGFFQLDHKKAPVLIPIESAGAIAETERAFTTQSFMDEYGNWIYLTPMVLGGVATMLAAAWKFLGIGGPVTREGPLDSLYALARRTRRVDTEAELQDIEEEIDTILKAERAKSAAGDESAVDDATLNVAAHRLESLIHDRRALLAKRPAVASAA